MSDRLVLVRHALHGLYAGVQTAKEMAKSKAEFIRREAVMIERAARKRRGK